MTVGHHGVVWDDAYAGPAQAKVKLFGGAAGDGVQNEECFAGLDAGGFGLLHKAAGDALFTCCGRDEELGDIGTMRLVGRHGGNDLDGANDGVVQEGGKENSVAFFDRFDDGSKECFGFGLGEAIHEADGGSAGYAIEEDLCKRLQIFGGFAGGELANFEHG